MTFEELEVREDLLRAITEMGFENPMPVQEKVIPHLLHENSDVVALAQTGNRQNRSFRPARHPAHRHGTPPAASTNHLPDTRTMPTNRWRPRRLFKIHSRPESPAGLWRIEY